MNEAPYPVRKFWPTCTVDVAESPLPDRATRLTVRIGNAPGVKPGSMTPGLGAMTVKLRPSTELGTGSTFGSLALSMNGVVPPTIVNVKGTPA